MAFLKKDKGPANGPKQTTAPKAEDTPADEKTMPDYEGMTEEEREEHMKALRAAMGEEEDKEAKAEGGKEEEEATPSASQGSAPPPSATGEDPKASASAAQTGPATLAQLKAAFTVDGAITQEAMAFCFVCAEQGLSVSQAKAIRELQDAGGQAQQHEAAVPERVRQAAASTQPVKQLHESANRPYASVKSYTELVDLIQMSENTSRAQAVAKANKIRPDLREAYAQG